MKGIALSSSSIEEYEKFRSNKMYEDEEVQIDFDHYNQSSEAK